MPVTLPDRNPSLLEILYTLPTDRPLLRSGELSLNVGAVITRAEALRQEGTVQAGQAQVLHRLTPMDLLLHLIAGDGFCTHLLLLPEDISPSTVPQFSPTSNATLHTEWLLATSGTTGTPKLISHSLASLCSSLKHAPETGAQYRWGLLYDPCRFAGIQVALQALCCGSELVLPPQGDFNAQIKALLAAQVNALSATPTLWRKLLIDGRIDGCPLRQITLGGEIVDQKLLDYLQQKFPTARISHIYAATEIGVGFTVTDGCAGFPLSFVDEGVGGNKLRIDTDNRLWLQAKVSPTAGANQERDAAGFLNSHDQVEVRGNRVFFLGRDNGTINVGGNKVHPERVEGVLRELAEVLEARVQDKKNPFTGEIVVADIVTVQVDGDEALRQTILDHCRHRLEAWQVPALIRFVNQLDTSPAGKLNRTGEAT